jgi:DNA invertase Pin-like site-specific DNA recombinase
MLHSLSAQVSYYNDYIQRQKGWVFAGVFVDEAVTGTKDTRSGFQDMLAACRARKIDLIITKSITRFARNTVTLLETVRELKELGVDVYFEKENIHSISEDGELMLTILASYAQEESRSASENCKWRIRKRFALGELVTLRFMYGYSIRKGLMEIVEHEAKIVRMIFDWYVNEGIGCSKIAKRLREMGVEKIRGGQWVTHAVADILKNEKYAGNALLQKTYIVDHLSKKKSRNIGLLPQYYAEATHPAIVEPGVFEKAQQIMAKRRSRFMNKGDSTSRYPFSGMILCPLCGKKYKRKTTHGKVSWNCTTYLTMGSAACLTKQIPNEDLIAETTSALGLREFDEEVFSARIERIEVPSFNHLLFVFKDGITVERVWEDRSRSESWTPEMRRRASEQVTLEQRERGRQQMHEINRQRRRRA